MTSVEPRGQDSYNRVDLYEYTHHSHAIQVPNVVVEQKWLRVIGLLSTSRPSR